MTGRSVPGVVVDLRRVAPGRWAYEILLTERAGRRVGRVLIGTYETKVIAEATAAEIRGAIADAFHAGMDEAERTLSA